MFLLQFYEIRNSFLNEQDSTQNLFLILLIIGHEIYSLIPVSINFIIGKINTYLIRWQFIILIEE